MSGNILENIYGSLFSPLKTFKELSESDNPPVFEAFFVLVIISIIGCLVHYDIKSIFFLGVTLISYVIFALISWVFMASVIDGLSSVFCNKQKFDTLLVLTSFSLVPWILMAPVSLFKSLGVVGILISICLGIIIWIWTTILFLLAVAQSYKVSIGSALILAIMPFIGLIIVVFWLSGFFSNLISIVSF